jgi:tRNA(Arg) A34 adenosine deaminase TadA
MRKSEYMREAIVLATENVELNLGGPFGAVIVKDGIIVSSAANSVTRSNDPTAHAEINAIRDACKYLNTFSLEGCEIYSSCEPCAMCLSAIYWARINKIYYGNTAKDAAKIGFNDSFIYDEIGMRKEDRSIPSKQILHTISLKSFDLWAKSLKKISY